MNNFWRVVTASLRHRVLLLGILATSAVVALFWGANIGAVYPVIEIVFQRKSLHNEVHRGVRAMEASQRQSFLRLAEMQERLEQEGGWQLERRAESNAALVAFAFESQLLRTIQRCETSLMSVLPHSPFKTLLYIVVYLFVGTMVKCVFLAWNMYLVAQLSQLTTLELRNEFYRRTLAMELSAFDKNNTGELMSRFTNDIANITNGVHTLFGKTLREPLKMVVCVAGAAMISWRLLLVSLVIAPICVAAMYFLAKSIKRANRRAMEEMSRVYSRLAESFAGIKVVKAYTMERMERARFLQTARELYRKTLRITYYAALTRSNNELLGVGVICLSLLAGGYLVLSEDTRIFGVRMAEYPFTIGSMMLFYGFLIGISDPARKLADVFNGLQGAAAASDRVFAMLDREPTLHDPAVPKPLPRGNQDLVFDSIAFHYDPENPVLRDVTLRIPAGKTVAIVGPNGCGKSTLLNLLMRFWDPTSGSVRWGGVDLRQVTRRALRKRIALVTQQTWLFDDTIENNIRYGSPRATREQVIEAAKRAYAHEFISTLGQSYDHRVGEGGGRLSGGQRQRIALARAFLRDPDVLILDEATSQVDQESERLIQAAIDNFAADRTCLFITHRMTACAHADIVVVMDNGSITSIGSHEQLLGECGLYQRLSLTDRRDAA